ncbi:replication-associated recombination protein A [candidate division TA06 bacterium]|uniref:Replication-associated recombination protein A n=1 Tax=candidate division TA06 bacterium TaxID=2250710 RepID=A0A660SMJ7_UNCT6|nr:MAG: replication-associated recombination protein A [candidate division TA06 bacterium]
MNLFNQIREEKEPLAYKMNPNDLSEFIGQMHVLTSESPLYIAISKDRLYSSIFYGPPGSGKTSLVRIIKSKTKLKYHHLNAAITNLSELKPLLNASSKQFKDTGIQTIIFMDEIHRFNKMQQDAFLPHIENGSVILIGTTTENPSYSLNNALISRIKLYRFFALKENEILEILKQINRKINSGFDTKLLRKIANNSNGDARIAISYLEFIINNKIKGNIDDILKNIIPYYRKKGAEHFNTISVLIKSIRGSDIDASLYWLFRLLRYGEDPIFIFRRLLIIASEDIGNADPDAIKIVTALLNAFEHIGYPEGEYFLAHSVVYLASAPKSNSIATSIRKTKELVEKYPNTRIPKSFINYKDGNPLYKYPHNYKGHIVEENYLPNEMGKPILYNPSNNGFEKILMERIKKIRSILGYPISEE